MSRSRKAPIWTEGYKSKARKKKKHSANKTVRNIEECVPNGGYYKKEYESWDIVDFKIEDKNNPKAKRK